MVTRPLKRRIRSNVDRSPLLPPELVLNRCLELEDNSVAHRSAVELFNVRNVRDPAPAAARLAEQFIEQNRRMTALLDVELQTTYDGREVGLLIRSGNSVGAIPLASPTSAQLDFGLVVQPRFPWAGIGPMLSEMGWRIAPNPLKLPLMHRSERRVPRWVLSSMIIARIKALLESLDRRFELVTESRPAPRGRVDWSRYATVALPRAQVMSIPCTFPDLREDQQIKGAIRHTLEQQIWSLETQREHGAFVHRLIEFAQLLLQKVRSTPSCVPTGLSLDSWRQRPLRSDAFLDGLAAIFP